MQDGAVSLGGVLGECLLEVTAIGIVHGVEVGESALVDELGRERLGLWLLEVGKGGSSVVALELQIDGHGGVLVLLLQLP